MNQGRVFGSQLEAGPGGQALSAAASEPHPDDIALLRRWFEELAEHVRAADYAAAHALYAEDVIAFGTVAEFVFGRDATERNQWRRVWGAIESFRFRFDNWHYVVSSDRLTAAGMALFNSTGFAEDGTPYDRPGRATLVLARSGIGAPWLARHSHFSLLPGVPAISYGRPAKRP